MANRRNPQPWLKPHPIAGKSKGDWVAETWSIYASGNPASRGRHYSLESALRQFVRICQITWREWGQHVATRLKDGNRTLWSTENFRIEEPRSNATPSACRAAALKDLENRVHAALRHAPACGIQLDRPCDCYRKELKAFLESQRKPEPKEPARRIRRHL